ncbi:MAG: hypothetical protein GW839_01765 [Flavobacteriales bacterium]|nr:hypothetical protein [Flavobacteriia bacterium]NCP05417.1 hypothetical protein [Flavobacteriales bacterium]PIV94956.1 MAG: hypothetical protein COW44_01620 [Flavobacteriaceae bacterium CG17_big_fil_post_rev_8_21_14_2_50_33_15]PIY11396.1 MAG: hypothetical protein COZ17_06870 [Flavobacteriaceae bacterium CG_4_10_14_3_um_filter_33_47]PJB19189.1 MAG: hypothetical protein CO117_05600 [Flavobacteriaceae bacterium CG_4_9_14_3_um_filter_33_16]
MNNKDYLKDISDIKNLMNRSSRFISLSGLSGILAGVYALIGAYLANGIITKIQMETHPIKRFLIGYDSIGTLLIIAFTVIVLSVLTAIYLTYRKTKKQHENIWDISSKRLIINFLIPLLTGGIFCIVLIDKEYFDLIASSTLIFYGLSLINASKYSIGDIQYLGFIEVVLGLICAMFPGYGFWLWVIGFGIMHIIYGTYMHFKYDKQ